MEWPRNELRILNEVDSDGNPTGGYVVGPGLVVNWQSGPLGRPPKPATGAFVEDVLTAALSRLRFYQSASGGKFACRENAISITKIEEAIMWQQKRRSEREARGVQGLHEV
jgi:hypothetical protein